MTAAEILRNYNLNRTHCRVLVLEQLMSSKKPLSQTELDDSLRPLCNRSTLYRILNTLVENKIIIQVTIDGSSKFFFDQTFVTTTKNHPVFIFFHCTTCHDIIPLQHIDPEGIHMPEGFTMKEQQFVIRGICKKCNANKY